MNIPFLSDDNDPDSDTLAEKLDEKRQELADVREQHANAREVVEEREQTLRELRARKEIGADVEDAIDEVETELEEAKKERERFRKRVDALEEAIPILEDRLEEAKAEEAEHEYDRICEEVDAKVKEAADHLVKAAELQAEIRELAFQGSRVVSEHVPGPNWEGDDYAFYRGGGPSTHWAIFSPVDVADYINNPDEDFNMKRARRGQSQLEAWLDSISDQIDVEYPDPPEVVSTKTPFDE